MSENARSIDLYDGGSGNDTLRLELTSAEWATALNKADVAAFLHNSRPFCMPAGGLRPAPGFCYSVGMTDLFDLTGKVALVTGGSRGLGYQMVKAFAANGADVFITSRKLDACDK